MGTPVAADHRHPQRVLRALGVTPYVLRGRGAASGGNPSSNMSGRETPVDASAVLVLPQACDERSRRLLTRAMQALGGVFAQAPQLIVADGELHASAPHAPVYLAFGEAQARALGRGLPTEVMTAAEVLLLDELPALRDAAAKRRLWQTVCGWRRRHRALAG